MLIIACCTVRKSYRVMLLFSCYYSAVVVSVSCIPFPFLSQTDMEKLAFPYIGRVPLLLARFFSDICHLPRHSP